MSSDPADDARADVGVLLVHGIGSQHPGETLTRWGDEIVKWLRGWDRSPEIDAPNVSITDPMLAGSDGFPGHFRLNVSVPNGSQTWVFAEAWWAEDIRTPKFHELLLWSFKAVPVTVVSHFAGSLQKSRSRIQRATSRLTEARDLREWIDFGPLAYHLVVWAATLVAFAFAVLLLGPIVLGVELLLLAIGLVPIGWLRSSVLRVQRVLTGSVGDTLVFLASPIQSAAIVRKVNSGVDYLERVAKRVVILAHSQGAVVAKRALELQERSSADLITIGSGIPKLKHLEAGGKQSEVWIPSLMLLLMAGSALLVARQRDPGGLSPTVLELGLLTAAIWAFIGLASALYRWAVRRWPRIAKWPSLEPVVAVVFGLGGESAFDQLGDYARAIPSVVFMMAGSVLVYTMFKFVNTPATSQEASLERRVRSWTDVWARNDPVPNGPTITTDPLSPRSYQVSNLNSALSDHSYYMRNREQCLSLVVAGFFEGGACNGFPAPLGHLRRGAAIRNWRVQWLVATRWAVAAAAFVFFTSVPSALQAWSASALQWGYRLWPDWIRATFGGLLEVPSSFGIDVMVAVAFGALGYAIAFGAWKMWDRSDLKAYYMRETPSPRPRHHWYLTSSWAFVFALSLAGPIVERTAHGLDSLDIVLLVAMTVVAIGIAAIPILIVPRPSLDSQSLSESFL